jgi:hypothetical protein
MSEYNEDDLEGMGAVVWMLASLAVLAIAVCCLIANGI